MTRQQPTSRVRQTRVTASRTQRLRGGISPKKAATITPTQTSQIKKSIKTQPTVNLDAAWDTAKSHWLKGMAGAYLFHMKRGEGGVQQAAVYDFLKELQKQTKIGNISPGRVKGSLLAKEEFIKWKYTPKTPTTAKQEMAKSMPVKIITPKGNEIIVNRNNILKNIVAGNVPGFKVKGTRIWDTVMNRPINPMNVYNKLVKTSKDVSKDVSKAVKITTSQSYPGKKIVTFPNGRRGTINATGRVVVGKNVAGKNYTFQDGILVKINNVVIKQLLGMKERRDITGRIIKDVADVVTTKTWNFIKKVNKKLTLKAPISNTDKKRIYSELKKLESKKNLSKRDNRIKKDLEVMLETGSFKILRGEVDLGGRAIAVKLLSKFPSYAKLFSKKYKDFGKVGKGNTIKEINTLQDFRQGQLAQAYLKAKNAQLGDKTIGSFVSMGGKPSSGVLKELNKKLRAININPKDITLSRYAQSFKVPSNVPKTEALIKILKTGKMFTQKQLNKIPKFYDFKREGVLVTKNLPSGNVKVVAMEYNRVGNTISHISYKVGVGTDTHAVVSTFKKVRRLAKVKGVRVKPTGVAVVKARVLSKKKLADDVEKTVSQMKTKKVFFNNKRLTRNEIKSFASVLKSQSKVAANKKLSNVIAKLYKKSPAYNISGITNVVRVKRTLNKIIFSSGKKKVRTIGVSRKGDFLEIGFTKARIPSDRKIRAIAKVKVSPVGIRKAIKLKPIDKLGKTKIDNTIRAISRGVSMSTQRLVKLEVKKGATQSQVTNVKNAVMGIQTIVRPVMRSSKAAMTKTKVGLVRSNVKKMLPGLSNRSKVSLVALTKSLTATQTINKLAKTPVQKNAAKTIQGRILKRFSALKTLSVKPFKKPYPAPKPKPRPLGRPIPTPKPKPKKKLRRFEFELKKANIRKLSKPVMTYAFSVKKGDRMVRLKMPPMTLQDSWDVGSYVLDHKLQRTGKLIPVGKNAVVAKLGKNVANYYLKNSKKFRRARIKKGKALSLVRTIIEKSRYTKDLPSERRALQIARKRATAKRIASKKPPIKRKVASVVKTSGSAIIQRLKRQRALLVRKISVRKPIARRRVVKRKLSPLQRRVALLNLKRAGAKRKVNRRK